MILFELIELWSSNTGKLPRWKGLRNWRLRRRHSRKRKKHGVNRKYQVFVIIVQSLSNVWLFVTLSFTIYWSLLKLMSIESTMPSNHLILCRPLLFLPSVFSSIRVFSNESTLWIRWPKYWSFSFIISPSNEHSGLISFTMDWLDLLASLLQHHKSGADSKELILSNCGTGEDSWESFK